MAFNTPPIGRDRNECRPLIGRRQVTLRKEMNMDWQSKDKAARPDDAALKVFVRSSPRELAPGELDRVAGGAKGLWVPDG